MANLLKVIKVLNVLSEYIKQLKVVSQPVALAEREKQSQIRMDKRFELMQKRVDREIEREAKARQRRRDLASAPNDWEYLQFTTLSQHMSEENGLIIH